MVLHAWCFTERNRFCFRYRVLVCTVCWEEPSCFGIRRKLWLLTWRWHPNSLLTSILNISPVHSKYWPSPISVSVCMCERARVCVRESAVLQFFRVWPHGHGFSYSSLCFSFICFCWTGALSVNQSPYAMPSVICSCAVVMWVLLLSIFSLTGRGGDWMELLPRMSVKRFCASVCLRDEDKTSPSSSGFYHTLSVSRFLAAGRFSYASIMTIFA